MSYWHTLHSMLGAHTIPPSWHTHICTSCTQAGTHMGGHRALRQSRPIKEALYLWFIFCVQVPLSAIWEWLVYNGPHLGKPVQEQFICPKLTYAKQQKQGQRIVSGGNQNHFKKKFQTAAKIKQLFSRWLT